jgi:transcriptional regulator with GAF, ATPase, and Fis domain
MNPRVFGISGPFQGVTHPLPSGELSIGRDPSNHLWVPDPVLSRQHCVISHDGDQFLIRDLGSRNGTIVNGLTVQELRLHQGDQISIGDSVLVFLLDASEQDVRKNPVEFVDTIVSGIVPTPLQTPISSRPPDTLLSQTPQARLSAGDLSAVLELATHIGGIWELESLQWQLLGFIFDIVPAERGAIVLFEDPDQVSSVVAWDRMRGPDHPVQVSRTVVQRVVRERAGLVVNDVLSDKGLSQVRTVTELQIRSVLCVPLIAAGKILGTIYLDSQHRTDQFDETRLQVMSAIAGIAALALGNVEHIERLQKENQQLQVEINLEHNMVGSSQSMQKVFQLIRRVAPTESTVLIEGESGTGKELAARAIHRNSPRAEGPFVAINCAAIPDSLLESELFGHEKGAFTGANALKKGKLEAAAGGTLFLDEIGELAAGMQAKLLRVLQEREFERVGGTHPVKLDGRIVAATNRSLADAVEKGIFRNDLYHRLNVVVLTMPGLRERHEDIPVLAEYFIAKISRKCKTRPKQLSPEAKTCLMKYQWPGNIRELENALEHAIVLGSSNTILPDDLPEAIVEMGSSALPLNVHYHAAITDFKKQLVREAFRQAKGNYLEAAINLGMHPNSLLRLVRNLDLKSDLQAR